MAKLAANKTWIWMDYLPIRTYISSLDLNHAVELPVVTALSDTGPRRVEGNFDMDQSFNGFFDGTNDAIDEFVHDNLLGTTYSSGHRMGVCFGSASTPDGYVCYENLAHFETAPWSAQNGGATLLNFVTRANDTALRGTCIGYDETVVGAQNGTGYNLGVTSATEYFGVIVRALYGSTWGGGSITVSIQQSQNDGGADPYAAINAGFQATFSANGRSTLIWAGVTEAWKRYAVTACTATNVILEVTAGTFIGVPNLAAATVSLP